MKITLAMLFEVNASGDLVAVFRSLFPTGEIELTEELCIKYADKFDWDWLAETFLIGKQFDYIRQTATLKEQYKVGCINLQTEYRLGRAKVFYKLASGN